MTLVLLLLSLLGQAPQEPSPEELKANREKKLAEPFLRKAPWTTDYDEALRAASSSGKLIFAYFTASHFR